MVETAPYPDNDPAEWVREDLILPTFVDGFVQFEYAIYANAASKAAGDDPFIYTSHKAQIRGNRVPHHRIIRRPSGALVHVSGAEVLPKDMGDFFANDPAAHRWIGKIDGKWIDDKGRRLAPIQAPTYSGVMEGLDPQWPRESFFIPQAQEIAQILTGYGKGAQGRRLSGDHRGTTLDLQVGASADDAYVSADNPDTAPYNGSWVMLALTTGIGTLGDTGGTNYGICMRFQGVAVAAIDTIDVAYISTIAWSTEGSTTLNSDLFGEDADDAAVFVDSDDYNARSFTAAVADDDLGTWTNGVFQDSGSIVTPVTTIKDRAGWAKNNSMSFLWADGDSSDGAFRFTESYDSASAKGGKLHIEYTAAATGAKDALLLGVGD